MRAKPLWRRSLEALAVAWPAGLALAAGQAAPATQAANPALETVVAAVVLNGTLLAEAQLLHRDAAGPRLWLPTREARAWRLALSGRETRVIEGLEHTAFCSTEHAAERIAEQGGERCFYDDASALLTMSFASTQLYPLRFVPAGPAAAQASSGDDRGAWLNYDLSAWRIGRPGLAAQLDGRLFAPEGFGAFRLDAVRVGGHSLVLRRAWLWQTDLPDSSQSVQAGHVSMPDTLFGAGMPLVGMRWGSNPRLRPYQALALRPRFEATGTDRALRADVFVDGVYRQTAEVPYGPFSVDVVPLLPGRGQIDVVTTDLAGRQQRASLPYYQAPNMLASGALEWSLDAGKLEGPGGRASRRSLGVLGGSARLGVDSRTTVQAQALLADGAKRLALAADTVDAHTGLSSVSLVLQETPLRRGRQAWLGVGQELLTRGLSGSLRAEGSLSGCTTKTTSAEYDRYYRPCRRLALSLGADLNAQWSLSTALQTETGMRNGVGGSATTAQVAVASLRWQPSALHQLSIAAQRTRIAIQRGHALLVSWSMPLGPRWLGRTTVQQLQGGVQSLQWSAQEASAPDASDGPDKRQLQVYGSLGPQAHVGGRVAGRGIAADWRVEARASHRQQQASTGVAGALGWTGGRWFASRRIDDAFVLVDAGLPNLPVLLDNREVARTNASGWAVVADARAWQANVVGVDIAALPIEFSMPRDQLSVVPRGGSGAVARFDLSDGGIALAVRDETSQRLPVGATVSVSSQRLGTAVTSRSEVFIERSDRPADISISWPGHSCALRYEPQTDLARHTCVARLLP